MPIPKSDSGEMPFLDHLEELRWRIIYSLGSALVAVGIGCAGSVDPKEIRIRTSPNLVCLENYPIGKYLRKVLRAPIVIGNDVQVGVYAEHRIGAAVGCRSAANSKPMSALCATEPVLKVEVRSVWLVVTLSTRC